MINSELDPNRTDTRRAIRTTLTPETERNTQAIGLIAFIVISLLIVAGFIYYNNQATLPSTPKAITPTPATGTAPNVPANTTIPNGTNPTPISGSTNTQNQNR